MTQLGMSDERPKACPLRLDKGHHPTHACLSKPAPRSLGRAWAQVVLRPDQRLPASPSREAFVHVRHTPPVPMMAVAGCALHGEDFVPGQEAWPCAAEVTSGHTQLTRLPRCPPAPGALRYPDRQASAGLGRLLLAQPCPLPPTPLLSPVPRPPPRPPPSFPAPSPASPTPLSLPL